MEVPYFLACSICKDPLDAHSDKKVSGLKCGHILHHDCVRQWWASLFSQGSLRKCPVCQTVFYYDSLVEIFPTLEVNYTIQNKLESSAAKIEHLNSQLKVAKKKIDEAKKENDELMTEMSNMQIELDMKTKSAEFYRNQATEVEFHLHLMQETANVAYERCTILQGNVDREAKKAQLYQETLETRTQYYLQRLSEVTRISPTSRVNLSPASRVNCSRVSRVNSSLSDRTRPATLSNINVNVARTENAQTGPVDLCVRPGSSRGRVIHSPR